MLRLVDGLSVIFDKPNEGFSTDAELCRKYLKLGETYSINHMETGKFYSRVFLNEIKNKNDYLIAFNTENFSFV